MHLMWIDLYFYQWLRFYMLSAGGLHDFRQTNTHSLPLVGPVRVQTFLQDRDDLWKDTLP